MVKTDRHSVDTTTENQNKDYQASPHVLKRKVFFSYLMLAIENIWPTLWPPVGVVLLFIIVSLTGIWPAIPALAHKLILAFFGISFLVSIIPLLTCKFPTRQDALRRLEKNSGLKHNPATSYEDQLGIKQPSRATRELWEAHRKKLTETFKKMKVGRPRPRVDKHDPFAIRVVLTLICVIGVLATGKLAPERILSAFQIKKEAETKLGRLDAWITPPAYTGKPPVILKDGSKSLDHLDNEKRIIKVPENSELIIRVGNTSSDYYEILKSDNMAYGFAEQQTYVKIDPASPARHQEISEDNKVKQFRIKLDKTISIKIKGGASDVYQWQIYIEDDVPPKILLVGPPKRTIRNAIQLEYIVLDDYGVSSANATFTRPQLNTSASKNNKDIPLGDAPEFSLNLPGSNSRSGRARTYKDLTAHPWAGLQALMILRAKDEAGQTTETKPRIVILPSRKFYKPLAKALVEQRRKLVLKPHSNYNIVMRALNALTIAPEKYIKDTKVYLGIRTAYWRMKVNHSRKSAQSVADQLWNIALYIEDGDLSETERQMKLAQNKLAKGLQNGASGKEIRKLLNELRETVARFLLSASKKNQSGEQLLRGTGNQKVITPQDLDQMLRNIEELAKSGSRDLAAKMLNELREMLENINTTPPQRNTANSQMMKAMETLGKIISDQQKLLDRTFSSEKKQSSENASKKNKAFEKSRKELANEQKKLLKQLQEFKEDMAYYGMSENEDLSQARSFMNRATQSLNNSKLQQATQQQTLTLNKLRKGAQAMANQALKRMGQPMQAPMRRDPFGRPTPNNGPDFGGISKLNDKVDVQRAREILEELRNRYSNSKRPPIELDYLERLLKRF